MYDPITISAIPIICRFVSFSPISMNPIIAVSAGDRASSGAAMLISVCLTDLAMNKYAKLPIIDAKNIIVIIFMLREA